MSELLFETAVFALSRFAGPAPRPGGRNQPRWQLTTLTPDGIAVLSPSGLRRLTAVLTLEVARLDRVQQGEPDA